MKRLIGFLKKLFRAKKFCNVRTDKHYIKKGHFECKCGHLEVFFVTKKEHEKLAKLLNS